MNGFQQYGGVCLTFVTAFLLLVPVCTSAQTKDTCHYGSEQAGNDLVTALSNEKTCQRAAAKLHACMWGSSADTQFAAIVVGKCEGNFFNGLSPAGKKHYGDEMQLCAYEFSKAEGTLAMSEAAMCQVDVAARFEADPALAEEPEARASFDCSAAHSLLENAICSDIVVGRADIVLSRKYRALLKSADTPQDRLVLTENERKWLSGVPDACRLVEPFTAESLSCVRNAFEDRFTALGDCEGPMSECLAGLKTTPPTPKTAPRASFECEKPATSLEIVICADAELGQTDIRLAQAYHDAQAAMGPMEYRDMATSEHEWLRFVNQTCPLGAIGGIPSALARSCVRTAFETRIQELQECPQRPAQERISCLNNFALTSASSQAK